MSTSPHQPLTPSHATSLNGQSQLQEREVRAEEASAENFVKEGFPPQTSGAGNPTGVAPSHRLATKIEAILYLKGQPLSIAELAEYAGCDRTTLEEGIIELLDDYAHRDSALEVIETPSGYSLQLRFGFQELVQDLIPVELGVGALRTLAAIALHSPITQTDVVDLRGSGAYQHIQELVELGFVRKRRQADCRSSWLHITDKFHQYFNLEQLPQPFLKNQKNEE